MKNKVTHILDTLYRCGIPCQLPGVWSRFAGPPSLFRLENIEAVQAQLLQAHSPDELTQAGLGTIDAQGEFRLCAHLVEHKSLLLALRRAADKTPFAIVSGMRSVQGQPLQLKTFLADHIVKSRLLSGHGQLLVAFTMEDLAVLRSARLPTIPWMDLAFLSGEGLEQLREQLKLDLSKPSGEPLVEDDSGNFGVPESEYLSLAFVDWSPSRMDGSEQPETDRVRQHLRDVCECLDFEPEFGIWSPSANERRQIEFTVRHGTPQHILGALRHSLDSSTYSLEEPHGGRNRPPVTLATAIAKLLKPQNQFLGHRNPDEDWQVFEERLEAEVLAPLLQQACDASDPLEKNQLLQIVGLSRLVHPHMLNMSINASRAQRKHPQADVFPFPEVEVKQLLTLSDRLASAVQAFQDRQEKRTHKNKY